MTQPKKPTGKHEAEGEEPSTPQSPATDARHPDTEADKNVQPPAQQSGDTSEPVDLDPKNYGFRFARMIWSRSSSVNNGEG